MAEQSSIRSTAGNNTTLQQQMNGDISSPPPAYIPSVLPTQQDLEAASLPPGYERVANNRLTCTDNVPLQDLRPLNRLSPHTRFADGGGVDDDATTLFEYPKPKFTMFDQSTTKKGMAYVLIVFFVISGVLTIIGLIPTMLSASHAKNTNGA
ncbi:hypothetical protein V1509DRAFT_611363 [Lipomyces kononenkoae]